MNTAAYKVTMLEPFLVALARELARGEGDLAEDLAQEGRIAVWNAVPTFDPSHKVPEEAFLKMRARQRMLDALRVERRHGQVDDGAELADLPGQGATLEDLVGELQELDLGELARSNKREQLLRLVPMLPDRDQELIRGRLEGVSFASLASRIGLSKTRVRKLVDRAMRRLEAPATEPAEEPERRLQVSAWVGFAVELRAA